MINTNIVQWHRADGDIRTNKIIVLRKTYPVILVIALLVEISSLTADQFSVM